ncbi:MAG: hypothetical protein DBY09_00115 [Selenomonadales bacterium]|jgi:ABC transporter, substrate-binding protein|nr:ABC transporter substrate-binding protein [Clostridiales bacterium]PWM01330.1 MAG: hypothetical protein DBY09_00115 [Selenomonadales bacterium]
MKKKLLVVLLALTLAICALAGCAPADQSISPSAGPSQTQSASITAVDFMENSITLEQAPKRIVSLTASNTEMLCELGLEDKLVGVDAYSDYPESVKELTIVGDYIAPDIEKIIELKPDIVFASNQLQAELIEQLSSAGVKVAASEPTSYEQLLESVQLIGTLGGAENQVIEEIRTRITSLESEIKAQAKGEKSAYYILSYGEYGDWSVGPGSFIYDVMSMAGLKFITEGMEYSFPMFSIEDLVAADPKVILCDSNVAALEDLAAAAGYSELTAVKDGTVIFADGNIMSRPTPRMMEEALRLAKLIWEE